jgi:hypothetical protein
MKTWSCVLALPLLLGAQVAFGKTVICHVPPDNPDNRHTISIGDAAVPAHLAHGDCLGPCEPVCGCPFAPAPLSNVNCAGGTFCQLTGPGAAECQFFCIGPPACSCGGVPGCCDATPCCEDCPGAGAPECNVSGCACDPPECCFTVGCP